MSKQSVQDQIKPKYPFERKASYRFVEIYAKQLSTTATSTSLKRIPDRVILVNSDSSNGIKVNYDEAITSTAYDYIPAAKEIKRDLETRQIYHEAAAGTPTICIIALAYTDRRLA